MFLVRLLRISFSWNNNLTNYGNPAIPVYLSEIETRVEWKSGPMINPLGPYFKGGKQRCFSVVCVEFLKNTEQLKFEMERCVGASFEDPKASSGSCVSGSNLNISRWLGHAVRQLFPLFSEEERINCYNSLWRNMRNLLGSLREGATFQWIIEKSINRTVLGIL